jgi:hypothetical protein
MHSQGIFILSVSWAVAATTGGTSQTVAAQSVPDFSGVWGHPSLPGFEPPASGPGPVLNKVRVRTGPQSGRSAVTQLVGDYSNPILKRQAAKAVKKFGEIELSGGTAATPINQCWPAPPPLSLLNTEMQMLQQPHQITILYVSYEVRHVRMNGSHPARVTPSWYGDSVGR